MSIKVRRRCAQHQYQQLQIQQLQQQITMQQIMISQQQQQQQPRAERAHISPRPHGMGARPQTAEKTPLEHNAALAKNAPGPPAITSKMSRDELVRRALKEFFTEGESRSLKQFCAEYFSLYADILDELNGDNGLCEIQEMRDRRGGESEEAGFTKDDSLAALDHINSIFSDQYAKRGRNQHAGSVQRRSKGFMPPLQIKGTCKGVQSKVVKDYSASKRSDKEYLFERVGLTYFQGWRSQHCPFIAELDSKK